MVFLFSLLGSSLALISLVSGHLSTTPRITTHKSLPGYSLEARRTNDELCPGSSGSAGYLNVEAGDKHHFFWLFESRHDPENDPVILWMTGGPGCSSVGVGAFVELGACLVNEDGVAIHNPHGWNRNATVIFLDQPVGVGYSYSSTKVIDVQSASQDSYNFLRLLFHAEPSLATRPLYIAGESFGGSWVTSLAALIHRRQYSSLGSLAQDTSALPTLDLQGVMLGNVIVDDTLQWKGFYETGCSGDTQLFNATLCQTMAQSMPRCQALLDTCDNLGFDMEACSSALGYCRNTSVFLLGEALPGRNPYNFLEPCANSSSGTCYPEMEWAAEYLNSADVREALGVPSNITFEACNMDLNERFTAIGETNKGHGLDLTYILNSNLRVLLYVGNQDWLANARGMQYLADEIAWSGSMPFRSQTLGPWGVRSQERIEGSFSQKVLSPGPDNFSVGRGKQWGGLTFLELNGAGHMVPLDKGYESVEMVNDWIGDKINWI